MKFMDGHKLVVNISTIANDIPTREPFMFAITQLSFKFYTKRHRNIIGSWVPCLHKTSYKGASHVKFIYYYRCIKSEYLKYYSC